MTQPLYPLADGDEEVYMTPWDGVEGSGAPYLRFSKLGEERTLTCRELAPYVLRRIHVDANGIALGTNPLLASVKNGNATVALANRPDYRSWEPVDRGCIIQPHSDLVVHVRSETDCITSFRIALVVHRAKHGHYRW